MEAAAISTVGPNYLVGRVMEYNRKKLMTRVNFVVKENDLVKRCRKKRNNYSRIVIARYLRDHGFTFEEIGEVLKRNHATVIHMVNNYSFLYRHKDFQFVKNDITMQLTVEKTIQERIVLCDTLEELEAIKVDLIKIYPFLEFITK